MRQFKLIKGIKRKLEIKHYTSKTVDYSCTIFDTIEMLGKQLVFD